MQPWYRIPLTGNYIIIYKIIKNFKFLKEFWYIIEFNQ